MVVNETLPMCPDIVLGAENEVALSEPVEVGPFDQGLVFVKLFDTEGTPTVDADVGISPTGYDEWADDWTPLDTLSGLDEEGVHAVQISNFGNWLRIRFELVDPAPDDTVTLLAWFVGEG